MSDLSTWLTKQQVAAALGVSEKTVTRMAARGELTQEILRAEGQTPRPVFEPDSVRTMGALERVNAHQVKLLAAPAVPEPAPKAKPLPLSELRHKTFLTTDEAVRYSGLPEAVLVDLAGRGWLRRMTNMKPYRYNRKDIEALEDASAGEAVAPPYPANHVPRAEPIRFTDEYLKMIGSKAPR